MDWEYIRPNGDSSVSLRIYPTSPSSHYDKVRDPDWLKRVYQDRAIEVGDLWTLDNPAQRDITEVKKIRIHVVGYRNNPLAWGKFAVYTNGGLYKGPQNPGSEFYALTSNPITGNPWSLDEIDALLAGVYHFDSGIPSGVGTTSYFVSVIYQNASVRTNKPTGYTGTAATLNGTVINSEGTFLDPYLASSSCIRVRFQWGETVAYGNNTPYQYGITGAFSAGVSGLNPAKIYHYRAVVEVCADSRTGGWDVFYGQDMILPFTGSVGHSIVDKLVAIGAI